MLHCPLAAALLLLGAPGGEPVPARDLQSDTWAATDALGRSLPTAAECGPPRPGKFVGIFYFLWLGNHSTGLYDNTKILAANPDKPQWGPLHAFHFWGEPQFGYYVSRDEWVIRRHAQMLTDAGVDTLFFDVTNAFTYDETLLTLCRVYEQIRAEGGRTPQLSFICWSHAPKTLQHLYDAFYAKGLHRDLWFRWLGKPLVLCPPKDLNPTLLDFFTLRESWAWTGAKGWFKDGRDKWPWLDTWPQQPGWHTAPDKPEQLTVCVAQHPTGNYGRSRHGGVQPPVDKLATDQGLGFAEQWERALKVDPEFVFVTGWNEWVAQRFENTGGLSLLGKRLNRGDTFFVDQYNQEFSRDIEPMRGGHGDNYYYQLAAYIRRFKGAREVPRPSAPVTLPLGPDFAGWRDVAPSYWDTLGESVPRDCRGFGDKRYVNRSGRNDFDLVKVARDAQHVYFYARTVAPLSPATDPNWMTLYLDTDNNPRTGWEGFNYRVSGGWLQRNTRGWDWEPVGLVKQAVAGNQLQLAVSRAALGMTGPLNFGFKWADNVPDNGDIRDWLDQGDTAPSGRFRYRFVE